MGESVALNEEAGKENEQTLANLSPAEEAKSKNEVELIENPKTLKAIKKRATYTQSRPGVRTNETKPYHVLVFHFCINTLLEQHVITFSSPGVVTYKDSPD